MPYRNVIKVDVADSYYHLYARGAAKQPIFPETADYQYFTGLLARYLSKERTEGKLGYIYPTYFNDIDLLCYCLMENHFHLLIFQSGVGSMSKFMRSLMTSYSRYFNLKYDRTGPLFEGSYKASRIDRQNYLQHISRYIHLNPRYWKHYPHSSLAFYRDKSPDWIKPQSILDLFPSRKDYFNFLADYEEHKNMLAEIKHELADK